MRSDKSSPGEERDSWKRKMGVEFSGLSKARDFLIGFIFIAVLVLVAMVIAFIAFG